MRLEPACTKAVAMCADENNAGEGRLAKGTHRSVAHVAALGSESKQPPISPVTKEIDGWVRFLFLFYFFLLGLYKVG